MVKGVRNCFPIFLAHYRSISKGKYKQYGKQGIAVTLPCGRCLVIIGDIRDLHENDKRLLRHIVLAGEDYAHLKGKLRGSIRKMIRGRSETWLEPAEDRLYVLPLSN